MGIKNSKKSKQELQGKPQQIQKLDQNKEVNECKIVLLGDNFVGKSSILYRFCSGIFKDDNFEATIGGAYLQSNIQLKNGQVLKLHLWDTGGNERFRPMAPLYYRDSQAAVLVYDIGNTDTFSSIDYWIKELDQLVKQEGLILALAGNKADLPDNLKLVSTEQAKQYSILNNMIFEETSAKHGEGIMDLFSKLAEKIAIKLNENNQNIENAQ